MRVIMRISVIGLGKLGLCTRPVCRPGLPRVGYDADPNVIESLRARRNPIRETGLDDLLAQAWPNLEITDNPAAAVRDTEISLIIVPTPSQPDGCFSNLAVEAVLALIGPVLRHRKPFTWWTWSPPSCPAPPTRSLSPSWRSSPARSAAGILD